MKYYRIDCSTTYNGTDEHYYMKAPKEMSRREIDLVIIDDVVKEYGEQWEYLAFRGLDENDEDLDENEILDEYWENNVAYSSTEITREQYERAEERGEYICEFCW